MKNRWNFKGFGKKIIAGASLGALLGAGEIQAQDQSRGFVVDSQQKRASYAETHAYHLLQDLVSNKGRGLTKTRPLYDSSNPTYHDPSLKVDCWVGLPYYTGRGRYVAVHTYDGTVFVTAGFMDYTRAGEKNSTSLVSYIKGKSPGKERLSVSNKGYDLTYEKAGSKWKRTVEKFDFTTSDKNKCLRVIQTDEVETKDIQQALDLIELIRYRFK